MVSAPPAAHACPGFPALLGRERAVSGDVLTTFPWPRMAVPFPMLVICIFSWLKCLSGLLPIY